MEKFLQFNGKNILFLAKDGQFWIAIKPICEALNVNFDRQYKNLKKDKILGPAYAIQPMQVPGDQIRNYVCLPEKFIYGWIFQIRSDSPELLKYKWKVYQILFDYFQGTITQRQKLLLEQTEDSRKMAALRAKLTSNPDFLELQKLEARRRNYSKQLKELDSELLQLNMFES